MARWLKMSSVRRVVRRVRSALSPQAGSVGWLSELFVFKIYYFASVWLFAAIAEYGSGLEGGEPAFVIRRLLWLGLVLGSASWIVSAACVAASRPEEMEGEDIRTPFCWTRASSVGTAFAFLQGSILALPSLVLKPVLWEAAAALAVVMSATGGIILYAAQYWVIPGEVRSVDALKAEHEALNNLFISGIIGLGVFLGGAVITYGFQDASAVVAGTYPSANDLELANVLVLNMFAVAYALVGVVIWFLRPIHRQLHALARRMEILQE